MDDNLQPYDELPSLCTNLDGRYREVGSDYCEECLRSPDGENPDQTVPNHTKETGNLNEERT